MDIEKAMEQRRYGRFFVSERTLLVAPKAIVQALTGMIVLRAEHVWCRDGIEYHACSAQFEPAPEGEAPLEYDVQFRDLVGGRYEVTWIKKG